MVVVRSRTKMTRELVEKADKCQIIARVGVGLDNIDQDAAKETATAASTVLKIAFQEDANHYISLHPGESIMFHHPGTSLDAVNDYWCTSGTGTVYAEVICGAK